MTDRELSPEQQKTSLAERLWLSYFNQYLFENGIITESQRNKMKNKIDCQNPSASKAKLQEVPEL